MSFVPGEETVVNNGSCEVLISFGTDGINLQIVQLCLIIARESGSFSFPLLTRKQEIKKNIEKGTYILPPALLSQIHIVKT